MGVTHFNSLAQPDLNDTLAQFLNAVNNLAVPTMPVTVMVDMAGGIYDDQTVSPHGNVHVILENGTIVGASPALIVNASQGQVSLVNMTLTDTTNSPTIQVVGGSLTLRNDVIEGLSNASQPLLSVGDGLVDLGTSAMPGDPNWRQHLQRQRPAHQQRRPVRNPRPGQHVPAQRCDPDRRRRHRPLCSRWPHQAPGPGW